MGSDQERDAEASETPAAASDQSPPSARQSDAQPMLAKADRRRKIAGRVGAAASLILVLVAVFVLSRTLANLNMAELRAAFAATSRSQIALGLLFTGQLLSDADGL